MALMKAVNVDTKEEHSFVYKKSLAKFAGVSRQAMHARIKKADDHILFEKKDGSVWRVEL